MKTYPKFYFLLFGLCFLSHTWLIAQQAKTTQEQSKPNIIVIVPDDLGWNDIGYHGSFIKTPVLDQLASQGIRLESHYVMPTCTPSRVSLMTGKYPSRYGVLAPAYGEVIDLGDPTLASVLKEAGYHTAIAGKWHMGSPPYTPLKYGFESSYGFFDGQIDPYTHEYKAETKLTSRRSWHRNDEYLDEEGHATDLISAEAVRVIKESKDQPFFLYVAYSVPHYPLSEPREWLAMYEDLNIEPSLQWFAASVSHMDAGIGEIVAALDDTQQRENTIIIFVSDNGGQLSWTSTTEYRGAYRDKPHTVLGNNFPLRGWKTELYEGGIRVPAFIHWPAKLKPRMDHTPIHIADWLPTLQTIAQGDQEIQNLDGKDLWDLLSQQKPLEERSLYWKIKNASALRWGDWKLLVDHQSDKKELYQVTKDFREIKEVSAANPEWVQKLSRMMEEEQKKDRDINH